MSVFAYLQRRERQTWMPRMCELGIKYKGPVLSGQMPAELAHQLANRRPPGERYRRVEDYDPVLREIIKL